jgi:GNAT superfamily N-acetyltransferase
MSDFHIRQARLDDLDVLLEFEQGVVEAERPFDPTLKKEGAVYYDIPKLIAAPNVEILVAEHGGRLIGSGYARIEGSKPYLKHTNHSYLGFMYVIPEFRGKGVNKLIIDALYDWSLAQGVREIRLEVYSTNAAAIRAYEKVGFSSHMLTMRKELDEG